MAQLTKDEPVLVGTAALAIVNAGLSVMVTHGVIEQSQAPSLAQGLAPIIAIVLTMLAGIVIRAFTAPWARVKRLVEAGGLVGDAQLDNLEAYLDQRVAAAIATAVTTAVEPAPAAPVASTAALTA